MAKFNGNDGNISIGTTLDSVDIKQFSATISRVQSDVSGFSNSGRQRRPGKWDINGTFSGVPQHSTNAPTTLMTNTANTVTLTMFKGTDTSATTDDTLIKFDATLGEVGLASVHDGDETLSGSFALSSTATGTNLPFTVAWLGS